MEKAVDIKQIITLFPSIMLFWPHSDLHLDVLCVPIKQKKFMAQIKNCTSPIYLLFTALQNLMENLFPFFKYF